jgi:PAS domain S-box-containing protein
MFSGKIILNYKNNHVDTEIRAVFTHSDENTNYIQIAFVDISKEVRKTKELSIANTQLLQSEKKFRLLSENVPDALWIADNKSTINYISSNISTILGYTKEEIVGHRNNLYQHVHKDDIAIMKSSYKDLFEKGKPYNVEFRIKDKTGEYKWIQDRALNINDEGNKLIAYGILSDITLKKEAELSLKENEQRLKSVIDSLSDLLFSIDENGVFKDYHNPYDDNQLLMKPEEFIGKRYSEVLPNHLSKKIDEAIVKIKSGKGPVEISYSIDLNDKKEWYHAKLSMRKNANNDYAGITIIIRNETDRINAENAMKETNERLDIALEGGNIAWWIWDYKTGQVHYDRRKPEMLGYSVEEFPNDVYEITEYIHTEDYDKAMDAMRKMLTGEKKEYLIDYRTKTKDGKYKWFYDRGKIVLRDEDGSPWIISGAVVDITERKEMEMKLHDSIATKDKLFSIIAHDIKNPFVSILNNTEHILDNYNTLADEKKIELLQTIDNSSKHTFKLLQNLLEWSRTQMGKIKYNPDVIDIYELAFNSTFIFNQQAKDKGIDFEINVDQNTLVECDRNMMNAVFRNLISNAIKFSSEGNKIYMNSETIDDKVKISIKDEGTGMNEEQVENLFKLDKSSSKPGTKNEKGTGLGLIITKDFIDIHDSEIEVESELGKGSTFSFMLKRKN